MNLINSVSPDAWIQSIGTLTGAFLGALIAGMITIKINKLERQKFGPER